MKVSTFDHCESPPKKISDQVVSNAAAAPPGLGDIRYLWENFWPLATSGPKSYWAAHIGQQIEYGLQQWNFRNLWENFSKQKEKGLKRQTWGFPVTFSSHVSVLGFTRLSIQKNLLWSKIVTNVTKQAVIIPLIDCLLNSLLSMGDLENVQQFWSFSWVWCC